MIETLFSVKRARLHSMWAGADDSISLDESIADTSVHAMQCLLCKACSDRPELKILQGSLAGPTSTKYLRTLFSLLIGSPETAVVNSSQFADRVFDETLTNDEVIVSICVVSLFTHIPT